MNFFKNIFSNIYEELWKAVIRPNRDHYRDKDLGPMRFSYRNKWFKRTDFSISNKKNYKWWTTSSWNTRIRIISNVIHNCLSLSLLLCN